MAGEGYPPPVPCLGVFFDTAGAGVVSFAVNVTYALEDAAGRAWLTANLAAQVTEAFADDDEDAAEEASLGAAVAAATGAHKKSCTGDRVSVQGSVTVNLPAEPLGISGKGTASGVYACAGPTQFDGSLSFASVVVRYGEVYFQFSRVRLGLKAMVSGDW